MADEHRAVLALWNGVVPEHDAAYNTWHAQEHVPQRLEVPGMLWARRYRELRTAPDGARYLTLYGLRDAEVLDSAAYLRLLSDPTPASRRMRGLLTHVTRWVCELQAMHGDLDGSRLVTWSRPAADSGWNGPFSPDHPPAWATGCFVARRLASARPLPWISTHQQTPADDASGMLWCAASDTVPDEAEPGGMRYERLPVG